MRTVMMTAAAALVPLAACVAASQPGAAVGPREIQDALVGRNLRVQLSDGSPAREKLSADGTIAVSGGLADQGRWRLSDKGYCTTWRRIRQGAERCFTVDRTPDGRYRVYKPDGEVSMTVVGIE